MPKKRTSTGHAKESANAFSHHQLTEWRDKLRQELTELKSKPYSELIQKKKDSASFSPRHEKEYYDALTFRGTLEEVEHIDLRLDFVEDETKRDIFDYFRNEVSSMPQSPITGKTLDVLIRDAASGTYLGMLQLCQDVMHPSAYLTDLPTREMLSKVVVKHIRQHAVNISICVPLQPFGFSYCGGKLLAMLAFSKEVQEKWTQKFGSLIAVVHTTSIHGKSVQYDRLKQLKFVGFTKGVGTVHIPSHTIDECRRFLAALSPPPARVLCGWTVTELSHQNVLKLTLQRLGCDESLLQHGQQRGIYVGFTGQGANEFLNDPKSSCFEQNMLCSANEIVTFWLGRWARQRATHLSNKVS